MEAIMATATKTPAKRKTTKTRASKAAPKVETVTHEFTEEQWAALLETYTTLKAAGLPIPTEVSAPVDAWLAQQKSVETVEAEAQEPRPQRLRRKMQRVLNGFVTSIPHHFRSDFSASRI